jgi:serine/threonine protein kinase
LDEKVHSQECANIPADIKDTNILVNRPLESEQITEVLLADFGDASNRDHEAATRGAR